jgi:glycosyltransferase 2 family protein
LNKKILILAKFSFSVGLFYLIVINIDFTGTISILKKTDLFFFLIALMVMLCQIMVANLRWQIVLTKLEFNFSFPQTLNFLWVGLFFNQALPSSIGGDAMRAFYLQKSYGNIKKTTMGVLLDRLYGLIGLFLLVVFVSPFLYLKFKGLEINFEILSFFALLILSVLLSLSFDLLPINLPKWKIIRGLNAISFEGRKILLNRNTGILIMFFSILVHSFSILAVILLSYGLGLKISLLGIIVVIPLVTILILIPISLAGWGVREGVMIIALGYLGVQPEQALALSILYGLLVLCSALPGGFIWLIKSNHFRVKA